MHSMNADSFALRLHRMVLRRGPFSGGQNGTPVHPAVCTVFSANVELAFLGHAFESLGRALDSILAVIAVGRKQPDHLVSAAGGRPGDITGSEIDGLTNVVFVLQRPLHYAKTSAAPTVPLQRPTEKQGAYSTAPVALASYIRTWQIRQFCRFFSAIRAISGVPDQLDLPAPGTAVPPSGRMRKLAVRTGVIHGSGELLRQNLPKLIDRNIEPGGQLLDGVATEHLLQLLGRNRQVLTGSDPGFDLIAEARLLQLGDNRA